MEANATFAPGTGLLNASRSVIVTVELVDPSAVTPAAGEALMEEFPATGAPAEKPTLVVTVPNPAGELIESVLLSATVEAIVPVVCPEPLVADPGCTRVLPLPVDANVGVTPLIAFPLASLRVMVTVAVELPFAVVPVAGDALIVEVVVDAGPGTKVTVVLTELTAAGVTTFKVLV